MSAIWTRCEILDIDTSLFSLLGFVSLARSQVSSQLSFFLSPLRASLHLEERIFTRYEVFVNIYVYEGFVNIYVYEKIAAKHLQDCCEPEILKRMYIEALIKLRLTLHSYQEHFNNLAH